MRESRELFLHRTNVANYRRRLEAGGHEATQRQLLIKLITEEVESARANGWPRPL